MTGTVAIVGRPNVGKSTLFNRLVGRAEALVDDRPGLTRDRRHGKASLAGLDFDIVDTAGLEDAPDDTLEGRMRGQTRRAVAEADVALLVIDGRAGLTPLDRHFADWLRRMDVPVILVANKCEGRAVKAGVVEAFELGLGEPVEISAAHGLGMADLAEALAEPLSAARLPPRSPQAPDPPDPSLDPAADGEAEDAPGRPIQLAIVGRPNVGKSTLINALLGDERMLTGPEPGVTRDAIPSDWVYGGRPLRLVDTAGLRRRARIHERPEVLSAGSALGAIRLAQVVVLVLDAEAILERQDLTIARHVIEEGRALVVAVNKWDLVRDPAGPLAVLRDRLETSLPQVRGVPTVTISALKGRRLDSLMDRVLATYDTWNRRVPTGPLNRWLAEAVAAHPPPMIQGRRLKLRYITQIKARPPTFALWASRPEGLAESYNRYLVNGLRETFDLSGVPVRLLLRKGRNPYAPK